MASTKTGWPKAFPKAEIDVERVFPARGGTAIAVLHSSEDAFTRVSKEEPKGVVVPVAPPVEGVRLVRGIASTPEGTFVYHPNDHRIVLCDEGGAVRAMLKAPWIKHLVSFLGHPTRSEIAFVWDEANEGVATKARLYRLSAADLLAGKEPTLLAERPYRPAIAFDATGALVAVDSGIIQTFAEDSTTSTDVAIQGTKGQPAIPVKLSLAGERLVLRTSPMGGDFLVLDRGGNVLRTFSGLVAEHLALVDGGRALALTAEAAKGRTGSASWVTWPDPRMLEHYVALLDVDTGAVRGLAPRSGGRTTGFVVIEGEILAVASWGRSKKIELVPWSAVAG